MTYNQSVAARNREREIAEQDARAIAYYTGAADARNHRPPQPTVLADVYTRGYDSIETTS